jgi:tetratricopeptide (TPR) repeat protein
LTPHVEIRDAWGSTFELVLRRPRANAVVELAHTLGVTHGDSAQGLAVIELAFRRRLYAELRDFLRTLPETAITLEWIGRSSWKLGDPAAAIAAYERAADLSPARAEPCTSLGSLHLDAGREADAQRWFREALSRDANNADARYGLVLLVYRSGDRAGARALALEAPTPVLRDLLDARTSDDPAGSLAAYERTLAAAPRCLDAIAGVAGHREHAGRWAEAIAMWERALAIVGDDARIRERLALIRARMR